LRAPLALALACGAALLLLLGFRLFDWEHGLTRAALVLALLAGLFLLPRLCRRWPLIHEPDAPASRLAMLTAATLLALAVGIGVSSVAFTARTGEIRLDQGQNTYRAALVLLRGESPYGPGQLLDLEAYGTREALRREAGLDAEADDDTLDRYWQTLDPELRRRLLPVPGPDAPPLAHREASVLGYKYGPVPFLLAAPLARPLGPAVVPLLNLLAFLAWLAVLGAVLGAALPRWTAPLLLAAVLATYEVPFNFLYFTASDVWPLLFSSLGVLALLRGRSALMGASLGLALGSKLLPSALFLPLLLRAPRPGRALLSAALVAAALYAPFVAWGPEAFILNVVRWPTLMGPDSTSWVFYAPAAVVPVARAAVAVGIIFVLWRLVTGRDERLFRSLAAVNLLVVLGGSAFHNNYVTWFAPWLFFALAEGVTRGKTLPRGAAEEGGQGVPPAVGAGSRRATRVGVACLAAAALCGVWLLGYDKKDLDKKAPKLKGFLPADWKQLGLTAEQTQQIYKTQAAYKAKIDALKQQIDDLKAEEKAELEKALTQAQRDRLREIRERELPEGHAKDNP
jgi:hypothetical protein